MSTPEEVQALDDDPYAAFETRTRTGSVQLCCAVSTAHIDRGKTDGGKSL
jgi:hypothetical protein